MIEGGYYIKARVIQNSARSVQPPHVRETWDYLLREANHAPIKYRGNHVNRGQLFRTYSEIREGMHWMVGWRKMTYSENQTKKAMKFLRDALMVTTKKELGGVLITICNYDHYQNPENYERTTSDTNERTIAEPLRNQPIPYTNKKDKNVKKKEEEISIYPSSQKIEEDEFYLTKKRRKLTGKRLAAFNIFWKYYNYPKGKAAAADSWLDIPVLDQKICDNINLAAQRESSGRHALVISGKTPIMAQGWLTARRWEDEEIVLTSKKVINKKTNW